MSTAGLVYSWNTTNNDLNSGVVSTSKEALAYKLEPYALKVLTLYTVELSVYSTESRVWAYASVQVYVAQNQIVSVIAGGNEKSVKPGRTVTLDASDSYDSDLVAGEVAALSYKWSCITIAPELSEDCGLILASNDYVSSSVSFKASFDDSVESVYVISVEVYDDTRSSSSSAKVSVLAADNPMLSLLSPVPAKVNPSAKIMIEGYISDIAGSFKAMWQVADAVGNIIDVTDKVLTPTTLAVDAVIPSLSPSITLIIIIIITITTTICFRDLIIRQSSTLSLLLLVYPPMLP
jgi:hypothetical protein